MHLGPLSTYRLPPAVRAAYGVDTAQELADQLGVTRLPTSDLGGVADAAYQSLRRGDRGPARALLVDHLGVGEDAADAALAKFPGV
jgi:hypothetical protein